MARTGKKRRKRRSFLDWLFHNPNLDRKKDDGRTAAAQLLLGFPFAGRENTRVHHPHEPGTDPRDEYRRYDSPL